MPSRFMISNGGSYLRRDAGGNFIPVKKPMADSWTQRSKAQNILQNCVNKNFRDRYKVIEVACEEVQPATEQKHEMKKVTPKTTLEVHGADFENHFDDIEKGIHDVAGFIQSSEERRLQLNEALSNVDKEITDIHHYIELGEKFNAYQGYLAFKMLQERLRKRRKIKDELSILTQLGECKVNSEMIESIQKSIDDLKEREYHPRVLTELFEEKEEPVQ